MSPRKETQKSAKSTTATGKKSKGFTDEERAANKDKAEGESTVLAKIAEMQEPDRTMDQPCAGKEVKSDEVAS